MSKLSRTVPGQSHAGKSAPFEPIHADPGRTIVGTHPMPCEFLVILLPGSSLLTLGCLLEPLQYIKEVRPHGTTEISLYMVKGAGDDRNSKLALSCSGTVEDFERRVSSLPTPAAVFFCCGLDVPDDAREPLRRLLRLCKRMNIRIFGLGAATWALAETGLLRGGKGVVHWLSLSAFKERNIDIESSPTLFNPGTNITTCAGELATLDMLIYFAKEAFGADISDQICDRFLVSRPRSPEAEQPSRTSSRLRYAQKIIQQAAQKMAASIEHPIKIGKLAKDLRISQRQLERLFIRYLGCSPGQLLSKSAN